jgi:class 3 adenylate cyclase/tetratricopeptide (TPR) repeat protein
VVLATERTARSSADRAAAHALTAYVPRILGDWLTTSPERNHRAVDGTLVFADISGFTRLTERLSRLGRVGAEEMSDALNATFTQLLGEAQADGADLVKWGGDAVLLLFEGPQHAARAARAAYRMRGRLRTVGRLTTSAGHARLRMSVGVHSGTFHFFLVGDPDLHRELIVCGADVSTVAETEAQANAGQIALSPATCALLDPGWLGTPVGTVGRLLRREPDLPEPVPSVVRPEWPETVVRGLPVAIREHLLQGPGEPEHRHIAVGFVAFSGTDRLLADEGPEATAAALDHSIRVVAEAVADHKVTFFETDINRDGGKIMLTAGAPTSAGHDAERMLRAARVVVERAGRLPMRVGVNVGNVFSGDFGPPFRRTYSVKGDAINLAARLVARAEPGQVLATAAVPEQSPTSFALRPIPPFTVKGKARPVHAVVVGPVRRDVEVWSRASGPLVGRGAEVRLLTEAVHAARRRVGGHVDVVGEPGLGKTRLLEEVCSSAGDLTVLAVTCDEFEASTPYHSFRLLLRELLGIREGTPIEAVRDRLVDRVRDNAPGLLEWLPLLGVPLGVVLPETERTRTLSDEFRKRRVEEVVGDFLDVLLPTPTLLVLDDAHFLDSASADLLGHLTRRLPAAPWLVVTGRREREGGQGWAGPEAATTRVRLAPLSEEEAVRLLQVATEDHPLPRPAIAAIAARAGGNPLFLESLIHAADGSGSVTDLPQSVQDLVTAQVDRLAPADRVVLRYASVLGMRFNTHDLATLVLGHAPAPEQHTYARLGEFLVRDSGAMLRFRHALMRDVAYHGLPFRTRQRLHAKVGERLERTNPDSSLELLSLHFLEARRYDKAWRYATAAARNAKDRFANQEAVDLFSRALEAQRRGPAAMVAALEVGAVLEELGDTWFAIGLPEQAADAYRRARRELAADPVRAARVVAKEARIDQRLRKLPQSLRRVSRALRTLEQEPGRWASSARSLLAMRYAISRLAQGRVEEALAWGHRAAEDAEESVDKLTIALAYSNLFGIYVAAGREPELPYGELALHAYVELEDLPHQADCTNNLAVAALDHNRWPEAVEMFGRAVDIYRQIGDTQGEALATYNRAEVLVRQGRLDTARPLLDEALVTARAVSDGELQGIVLRELGRIACRTGDLAAGLAAFERALAVFAEIDEPEEVPATVLAACEGLLLAGDAAGALGRVDSLPPPDDEALLPMLHRVRGVALLVAGDVAAARAELAAALRAARAEDNRYEEALVRLVSVGLPRPEGGAAVGPEENAGEASSTLAALGVVAVPLPAGVGASYPTPG